MASLWNQRDGCGEMRAGSRLNRRGFLQIGMLGGGLSLADLLRYDAQAASASATRDKSVIILWMRGGPSHIDMWDPKPDAPVEYRGEFGTMPTKVPGILLSDMLPRSAGIMDKWSIVRSLTHLDAGHSTADQTCFTGYAPGSPRVNKDAGRDHYPNVFSAALAGGGVQGGRVVGESDAHGAFPRTNPKTPQDVLATLYRHLGIDTEKQYVNAAGRPISVLPSGQPIDELF
ncbi:MAG TPA: DUF1501 domain-containing protein [Pirellulales bacterium]|jgi:uncharacterized protein (DUF1501 family)|nr:DUF1501 domain-containing protein [Pirellulales bacterium]